jgi:hypothetical protein
MSFSFRNIFSPDEGDLEGSPSGFVLPSDSADGEMSRGGVEAEIAVPQLPGQEYLVSELIAFIPPSISAQSGIPMARELRIPLPSDGSRDVKLSTIYQICPELFGSEITPLNDSIVTLPPKLGAMMGEGIAAPAADKLAAGFGATPASFPVRAGNPFTAIPRDMKDDTTRSRQAEAPAWPMEVVEGLNPFAGTPATSGSASSVDTVEGSTGGFAGFDSMPSSVLFGDGASAVTNEVDEKGGKDFPGNPFESEQGFKTLFSMQAEVDRDIPFSGAPTPGPAFTPSEQIEEPRGIWGTMFHGAGLPEADTALAGDESFSPPTFKSMGNLLKQVTGPAAVTPPVDFQSAIEPAAPSASAPAPANGPKVTELAQKEAIAPVSGIPAFTASTQGFAGFAGFGSDTGSTLSPIDAFASGVPFEATAPAPAVFEAPAPVVEAPLAPEPLTALAAAGARATAPAAGEASFDMRDLELRAIFSTSENFTLSMVARRVVGLPGIVSCSLSTPGNLVQASKSEDASISNEAPEMVAIVRSLAKLTGLPEARNFTLQTDRGIISLFVEGECCVMVHHEAVTFEPGVREKLILVARRLIDLEE